MLTAKQVEEIVTRLNKKQDERRDTHLDKRMDEFFEDISKKMDDSIQKRINHTEPSPTTKRKLEQLDINYSELDKNYGLLNQKIDLFIDRIDLAITKLTNWKEDQNERLENKLSCKADDKTMQEVKGDIKGLRLWIRASTGTSIMAIIGLLIQIIFFLLNQ